MSASTSLFNSSRGPTDFFGLNNQDGHTLTESGDGVYAYSGSGIAGPIPMGITIVTGEPRLPNQSEGGRWDGWLNRSATRHQRNRSGTPCGQGHKPPHGTAA